MPSLFDALKNGSCSLGYALTFDMKERFFSIGEESKGNLEKSDFEDLVLIDRRGSSQAVNSL